MEWIITGLLVPVIFGVWQITTKHLDNKKEQEKRLDDLNNRVTIAESKINSLEVDITEIKEIKEEINLIRLDIMKLVTLMEERTKRGP